MSDDLVSTVLNAGCDFPWSDGLFGHLERYIGTADHFLAIAQDLQSKSLAEALNSELDPVAVRELAYELERLQGADLKSNRRLIWGGLLVSIYAAFEQSSAQIFAHLQVAAGSAAFKIGRRENLIAATARHSTVNVGIEIFDTSVELGCLDQLRMLRKSFVHSGGKIVALPPDVWSAIQMTKGTGFPLEDHDERWCANAFAALHYLKVARRVMQRFSGKAFDKCLAGKNDGII